MNFISNLFKKKSLDDIRITPSDIPAMAKIKNEDLEAWKVAFLKDVYRALKHKARQLQEGEKVMIAVTMENGVIKDANNHYVFAWEDYKHLVFNELTNDGWTIFPLGATYPDDEDVLDSFYVCMP